MKRIVLASSNSGKLREFQQLLASVGMEVVLQGALGVPDAEEPHATFVENALGKARHAAMRTGLPALADDSGIVVEALAGKPGVHSARFAGEPRADDRNNAHLIELMRHHRDRRAHYYCVIVLVRHAADPEPLIADGRWHGEVIDTPRGAGGFGYDPYFLLPSLGLTAAEMTATDKNRVSHRGIAVQRLLALLQGRA
ncbi:MAG: RdgB/HAM1 family non-canonical purine NTP pyrophosphatase [Betaproteobacteria bacterium]|nr:RdgB/HAM1 family non-canonical purine NTP pyrophosphatase [Betaproteobacteria bacterium]